MIGQIHMMDMVGIMSNLNMMGLIHMIDMMGIMSNLVKC